MNSSPTISLNIWQTIKANPASHMVALAAGLVIAVILIIIICVCKWWFNQRNRSSRQTTSASLVPVYGPLLNINKQPLSNVNEYQFTPKFHQQPPMIPRGYSSLQYPINNSNLTGRMDTI